MKYKFELKSNAQLSDIIALLNMMGIVTDNPSLADTMKIFPGIDVKELKDEENNDNRKKDSKTGNAS